LFRYGTKANIEALFRFRFDIVAIAKQFKRFTAFTLIPEITFPIIIFGKGLNEVKAMNIVGSNCVQGAGYGFKAKPAI